MSLDKAATPATTPARKPDFYIEAWGDSEGYARNSKGNYKTWEEFSEALANTAAYKRLHTIGIFKVYLKRTQL